MFEICSDLSITGLKIYNFCQHLKQAKKWPNDKTFFSSKQFFKRPNGNPGDHRLWMAPIIAL